MSEVERLRKNVFDNLQEIERLNNKNEELLTLYTTEREVKDYYKNIINELENHCETMLSIFEQMTDEDKQKELHKYLIYDDFLTRLKRLKGDSSNDNNGNI